MQEIERRVDGFMRLRNRYYPGVILDTLASDAFLSIGLSVAVAVIAASIQWLFQNRIRQAGDKAARLVLEAIKGGKNRRTSAELTLQEKLNRAFVRLNDATAETQMLIRDLEVELEVKSITAREVEERVALMTVREHELRKTVAELEGLSPETLTRLSELVGDVVEADGKSSRKRDYALFFLGVLVSAITGVATTLILG